MKKTFWTSRKKRHSIKKKTDGMCGLFYCADYRVSYGK